MIWSTLTGLEELMQELDVLGRRSQIADGGWFDVFSRRRQEQEGRRRTRARREAWTGAVASR